MKLSIFIKEHLKIRHYQLDEVSELIGIEEYKLKDFLKMSVAPLYLVSKLKHLKRQGSPIPMRVKLPDESHEWKGYCINNGLPLNAEGCPLLSRTACEKRWKKILK